MADSGCIALTVDGRRVEVPYGTNVAALLMNLGVRAVRTSIGGAARGPLCGMGICFECRVTLDGAPHVRACMEVCREGLDVRTAAAPLDGGDSA